MFLIIKDVLHDQYLCILFSINSAYGNIFYHFLMTEKLKTFLEFTLFFQTTQSGNIIVKRIKFSTHLFSVIAFIATMRGFECEDS